MYTNTTTYATSREMKLELIDDSICDLFMEAGKYASPDRRDALKARLSDIIDALRSWRNESQTHTLKRTSIGYIDEEGSWLLADEDHVGEDIG